jgi:predicted DNA-binding transcriptional regulator AlpA
MCEILPLAGTEFIEKPSVMAKYTLSRTLTWRIKKEGRLIDVYCLYFPRLTRLTQSAVATAASASVEIKAM